MVQRFQPLSAIINDYLRITKESAEKSFRDAKNETALQVAGIDRHIRSLKFAIRCISSDKLESEFQLGNLEEQIESLLKLKRNPSDGSRSKPDLTIKQSETARPENFAEVGFVTSNTRLEPDTATASSSVNIPSSTTKKKSGKKHSLLGNKKSSIHVASHTSNYYPVNNYLPNQRQTWLVDNHSRSFTRTPNSDYNHHQLTQPGGPQLYQIYQPLNPYYRNH